MPQPELFVAPDDRGFAVKPSKVLKKTSGQRSSSVAILDGSTDAHDLRASNGHHTVYQCVCGMETPYEKNYLRHARTKCRMFALCTRI
jgi:hypothetical protein